MKANPPSSSPATDDPNAVDAANTPTEFLIEPALHCVFVRCRGRIEGSRLSALIHDIEADPAFRPGLDRFLDFREANPVLPTIELRNIANFEMRLSLTPWFRNTSVLVGSNLDYSVMRVIMALADVNERSFRIFQNLDQARNWLRLPASHELPWS